MSRAPAGRAECLGALDVDVSGAGIGERERPVDLDPQPAVGHLLEQVAIIACTRGYSLSSARPGRPRAGLELRAPAGCSAQHRRAEVLRDRVHDHEVGRLPAAHHRAAADADAAKARPLVRRQPRDVPLQRLRAARCAAAARGIAKSSTSRVASVPRPWPRRSPTKMAKFGCSVGVGDVEQPGGADRCGVGAVVDRELDDFGLASARPCSRFSSTHFSWLSGVATAHLVEAAPDLELVHPAGVVGGEVPPEGSQRDLLADDDEVRLVAVHPGIVSGPSRARRRGRRAAPLPRLHSPATKRLRCCPPGLLLPMHCSSAAQGAATSQGRRISSVACLLSTSQRGCRVGDPLGPNERRRASPQRGSFGA